MVDSLKRKVLFVEGQSGKLREAGVRKNTDESNLFKKSNRQHTAPYM
ncbi:MAG: hypothetical protein K6F93_02090 [Lachnospiraceae bacterium]|nr:hypothetical protein [Lachnospiraceae bacterium]